MKYTKKDIKEGMRLRCASTIELYLWKVGKEYSVGKRTDGSFILKDETGYVWNDWLILEFLNGKGHCKMEIVEEEQEMKKYVVVTKLIDGSRDQELLEVGKTYKVAEECQDMLYLKGVSIYVNEGEPSYYLRAEQYELVEKEETPTFKTTIDLKSAVQAKVDELRNEAEHLFKKRDRLEQQAINLDKKARKLNNLIESIKEFE